MTTKYKVIKIPPWFKFQFISLKAVLVVQNQGDMLENLHPPNLLRRLGHAAIHLPDPGPLSLDWEGPRRAVTPPETKGDPIPKKKPGAQQGLIF